MTRILVRPSAEADIAEALSCYHLRDASLAPRFIADVLEIAHQHGASRVRVFGSWARGEQKPGSDLDLLVELEPNRSLLDLVAIKQDLEDLLNCPVDVVTERSLAPYLRERVLAEALPLSA